MDQLQETLILELEEFKNESHVTNLHGSFKPKIIQTPPQYDNFDIPRPTIEETDKLPIEAPMIMDPPEDVPQSSGDLPEAISEFTATIEKDEEPIALETVKVFTIKEKPMTAVATFRPKVPIIVTDDGLHEINDQESAMVSSTGSDMGSKAAKKENHEAKLTFSGEMKIIQKAKKLRRQKIRLEVTPPAPNTQDADDSKSISIRSDSRRASVKSTKSGNELPSERGSARKRSSEFSAEMCSRMVFGLRLGLTCVDPVILQALAIWSYDERVMVQEEFYRSYDQDLETWLVHQLHSDYHPLVKALLADRSRLMAMRLRDALHDIYNRLDQIVEDLALHSCVDLLEVKNNYLQLFGENVEDHIERSCQSEPHIKQFLMALCRASADQQAPTGSVDDDILQEMVQHDWSSERGKFSNILSVCYKKLQASVHGSVNSKQEQPESDAEEDGFFVEAVEHFLSCVVSPQSWFCKKLYRNMAADNDTLLEILVARKDLDLPKISADYATRYGSSLEEAVSLCYDGKMTKYLIESFLRCHLNPDKMKMTKVGFMEMVKDAEELRNQIEGGPAQKDTPTPVRSDPSPQPDPSVLSIRSESIPTERVQSKKVHASINSFIPKERGAHPTVIGYDQFEPEHLASDLHKALSMDDVATARQLVQSIMCRATYRQRLLVKELYQTIYSEPLYDKLHGYLPSREAQLVLQLFLHPASIDTFYLKQALSNYSLDEQCLVLFLGHRYSDEIEQITAAYEAIFGNTLTHDLRLRLEDNQIQDLFLQLIHGDRKWNKGKPDESIVGSHASRLYPDSKTPHSIPIPLLIEILAKHSRNEILAIFREFAKISGRDIVSCVMLTTTGDFRKCLLGIINYVRDPIEFTARELYSALLDAGGNKDLICYVIFSRAERDLATVMQYFHMAYRRQLLDMLKTHLSTEDYEFLRHLCTAYHHSPHGI